MSSLHKGAATVSRIDLTGQRFGRLVVEAFSHSNNGAYWRCICDCGTPQTTRATLLRNGTVRSCGCGARYAAKENCAAARAKRSVNSEHSRKLKDLYRNMRDRCDNPENKRWANYGGRGISVCNAWKCNRRQFYEWVLVNGYRPGLQLDRIDVNGDYSPENCRFVDAFTQMNNTTRNIYITWQGERMSLTQWSREIGVSYSALKHRHDRGWPVERMFTEPFRGAS